MCRKIDYKKIGQNLEIFPAGDTGLRLRKCFQNFQNNLFLLFCCEMYRKIDEQLFRSLILKIKLLKHVIICLLSYVRNKLIYIRINRNTK